MQNYRGDKVYAVALLATGPVLSDIPSFIGWVARLAVGGRRTSPVRRHLEADMAAGLSAQAQAMPASIPVVDIRRALWQRCRGQDGSRPPRSAQPATISASSMR